MRFLLGVLLGGLATLGIATAVDAPTQSLFTGGATMVERGGAAWQDWWRVAGKRLFPAPARAPEPPVAVTFESEPTAPAEPSPTPVAPPAEERQPDAALDSAVEAEGPGAPEPMEVFADAKSPAMQPLPESPSPEPVQIQALAAAPNLIAARDAPTREVVWVPFRSRLSAQGFATALTAKTEHPFEVERRGPGQYQVLFTYADRDQRDRLLQQVRSVTGEAPP